MRAVADGFTKVMLESRMLPDSLQQVVWKSQYAVPGVVARHMKKTRRGGRKPQ